MKAHDPLSPLDTDRRAAHKLRNWMHSIVLLVGMLAVFSLAAATVFGWQGVIWALVGSALGLLISPRLSPSLILRMYRGHRLDAVDAPEVVRLVERLSRRAGLERPPEVYYLPSQMLNAFTVDSAGESAVAITDGMLRALTLRELAGVLAHEISHLRNRDTWVMGLADAMNRLTRVLSFVGLFLLLISVPWMMMGGQGFPWLGALLLMFAPTIGGLLQLALSRTREYDADLDAAGITGDPEGLAQALEKLERRQGRFWEEIVMPGSKTPIPEALRTHPPTEERVARLRALGGTAYAPAERPSLSDRLHPIGRPPRMRWPGVRY